MPQAAPITVNNGTNDVVFTPDQVSGSHASFQNLAEPNLSLREQLHFDRPVNEGAKTRRRQIRVSIPIEKVINGVTEIRMVTLTASVVSPTDVSVSDRARARALGINALSSLVAQAVFDNPEWLY